MEIKNVTNPHRYIDAGFRKFGWWGSRLLIIIFSTQIGFQKQEKYRELYEERHKRLKSAAIHEQAAPLQTVFRKETHTKLLE